MSVVDTVQAGPAPSELVTAYTEAWNTHDSAAVARLVHGSYTDPTLPAPVSGPALASMVDGLCAAFPDLRFEVVSTTGTGSRMVFEWRMHGTNDGAALPGAPARTGGKIDLPGVDVITVEDGRIVDVVGYFDRTAFMEQLGLQTFALPQNEWPVSYGTSVRMNLGTTTPPGALTMTWIEVDADEQGELVRRTTDIITALASESGFIGWQSTTIGGRNTTLTAWTSPVAAEAALARNGPHTAARARVEQEGFGLRGYTSFWQPYRVNPQFVECACGRRVSLPNGARTTTCICGVEAEVEPYL